MFVFVATLPEQSTAEGERNRIQQVGDGELVDNSESGAGSRCTYPCGSARREIALKFTHFQAGKQSRQNRRTVPGRRRLPARMCARPMKDRQ
jgi:hypothetical protein